MDYARMERALKIHYGAPDKRLVGVGDRFDSGYIDILRFFGREAADPSNIRIDYIPGAFECSDRLVSKYANKIEHILAAEGRLFTNGPPVMRVASFDPYASSPQIRVQSCKYGQKAGSCFALDRPDALFDQWGGTLRDYYLEEYPSRKLEDSPLALCLGVCAYVVVEEQGRSWLVDVLRSKNLASLESSHGVSVAGSVDFVENLRTLRELMTAALAVEAREELGLDASNYRLTPLAWAREVYRGEKPQLFGVITTSLTRKEIAARADSIPLDRREHDRLEFIELGRDGNVSSRQFDALNHEARANLAFMREAAL